MNILTHIIGGAIIGGLLALSDDGKVKAISTDWNYDVGYSISHLANHSIKKLNQVLDESTTAVSDAESAAQRAQSQVNYDSQKRNLEWVGSKIEEIDIARIKDDADRILSDIQNILHG